MTTAEKMVQAIEAALLTNVATKSITVDGQTITFNSRKELLEELMVWKKQAAGAKKPRSIFRDIRFS